jgi:hypothetical protein
MIFVIRNRSIAENLQFGIPNEENIIKKKSKFISSVRASGLKFEKKQQS